MDIKRSLKILILGLAVAPYMAGCDTEQCQNDKDCCDQPNPAYMCSNGSCMYNYYYQYNNEAYNDRVKQCHPEWYGTGGEGGGSGTCANDKAPDPQGSYLAVPEYAQVCDEWCWAASIAMVANYYNRSVGECELAGIKSGYGMQCCNYYGICANPCNKAASPGEILQILTQGTKLFGKYYSRALTEKEVQTELTNGRPVYVMFSNSFSGHAAVVSAYTINNAAYYHIIDPWSGPYDITYASLLNGPNGMHWSNSISRISTNIHGCNPDYNPDCGGCN